ncbi:MAG: RAMP superfamily CRISPR-associated protein [Nitrososphaeria archaeon]|nr:RAMP superfamily CRISPR-associated protein [Nitrososphaeria archaeon]
MKFYVKARAVGIASIGWSYPSMFDVDTPFIRKIMKMSTQTGNRDFIMQIYIPGSSFKGALRSAASRVASSYGFTSCGHVEPELIRIAHQRKGICDVCKLFGYPGSNASSLIQVSDLDPISGIRTFNITRTKLEDNSLKVVEGALYMYEHIDDQAEFRGCIEVGLKDPDMLGLILLGLSELRLGRMGRSSIFDLMIEESIELKDVLFRSKWAPLLEDLKRWLWVDIT